MTALIGPYPFVVMEGRLQAASSASIPTARGLRQGSRRPVVQAMATSEEQTDLISAWIQALRYRLAVGAVARVVDDGGVVCDAALIADVRTQVRQAVGVVTLETVWSIMPALSYGDYGQATTLLPLGDATVDTLTVPAPAAASSTTIVVGGITFTTATGDLQWPLSEGQITGVSKSATALGGAGASARPASDSGKLETTVPVADEAAGFDLMRQVRGLVGTFIDVSLGGVTISTVAVQDAQVTWPETKVLPSSGTRLAMVSWTLDTQDSSGTGGPAAEVQVATLWGNWQTVPRAWCEDDGEGLGGSIGQTTWTQDVGKVLRDGAVRTDDPTDNGARWVRIRARTAADGTASAIGTTLTPIWWGEVLRDRIAGGAGQSAVRTATCGGVIGALAKCWPVRWYEQAQDGQTVSNPGEVLPFNATPGGDGGGVGGTPDPADNHAGGVTIHDRHKHAADGTPTPTPWTARQVVNLWLAAFRTQYPQGPRPVLSGQVAALDYISAWDLTMRDFGQGLIEVVAIRWGLALRVEIDPATDAVSLRVSTGVATDTTIPGLGTLPANDRAASVDLTGSDVTGYDLVRAYEQQVDHLVIWAGHPWFCMTFRFGTAATRTTQIEKGWTADEETAWEAASDVVRNSPALIHVWRRWRLAHDYAGGHAGTNAIGANVLFKMDNVTAGTPARGAVAAVVDAQHGIGGYTGEFTTGDPATPKPQVATIRFTRDLPIWTAKDWAAVTGTETVYTATTPGRQHEGPMLFGVDASSQYEHLTDRWMVQVEDDAPGIVLGHNATDGAAIKAYLAAGRFIMVTIGVVYPLPWRESWRRAQTSRPRDLERSLVLHYPQVRYRQIVAGTVLGLTDPSTLKQMPQDTRLDWETTTNSGISKLAPLLALARLRHENAARALTYTRRGVIDVSTATAPGSLITTATVPLDGARAWAETINLARTGRTHHLVGGEIATSYSCEQLLPSRDKTLLAPPVALRALGKAMPYVMGGR